MDMNDHLILIHTLYGAEYNGTINVRLKSEIKVRTGKILLPSYFLPVVAVYSHLTFSEETLYQLQAA